MNQAKRVAKNTGILYIRMAITIFISLYVTRLVLAALGTEDFGTFNLVGGAIAMLVFLNNAMTTASQRFMSFEQGAGNREKQKNIFNVSVLLHFIIAIAVIILLKIAGYFLFNGILEINPERIHSAERVYQFLIISTFFTIISVPYDAVINAHENMLFVAVTGVLQSFLKLGIAFFITYTVFDKLIIYGLLMACLAVLIFIVKIVYCYKKYEEVTLNIRKYYDKKVFKEMSIFASFSFLGSSTSMIANYGQGIVLNMFFGTVVNAAQGITNQVSGQLSAFANTMMKALNPVLAKNEGAGNRGIMIQASLMGSKISFFLLVLFFVPILVETSYVLNVWLKKVPDFAIIFCKLYLIRNLIDQLFKTLSSSIAAHGNIKKYQLTMSVVNFLPLLLAYVLFSFGFPPYYMYISFLLYSVISSYIVIFFAWKNFQFPVKVFLKDVVLRSMGTFILVLVFTFILHLTLDFGLLRFVLVSLMSLLSFVFFVWYLGFTKNERFYFNKIIGSKLKKNTK
jgi:Na+-driven multidrug efflux pump